MQFVLLILNKVKKQKKYQINISGLSDKKHHFNFNIKDDLFKLFKSDIIQNGDLLVNIYIDKSEAMLQILFEIKGWVVLNCDRTLEEFEHTITLNKENFFQYGDTFEELDENIIVIPKNLAELDLSQYIYEYIILSLPIKKLHPKFVNESKEIDERSYIYSTKSENYFVQLETDNRWEALKKLKK